LATVKGGGLTTIVNCVVTDSGGENESVTVSPHRNVPIATALPEISPLALSILMPEGRQELVRIKLRGCTPPVTAVLPSSGGKPVRYSRRLNVGGVAACNGGLAVMLKLAVATWDAASVTCAVNPPVPWKFTVPASTPVDELMLSPVTNKVVGEIGPIDQLRVPWPPLATRVVV